MSVAAAIQYLSILAYPEQSGRGRARAEEAMRAYYLRRCKEAGTLKELGDILPYQQMENQFRLLKSRLEKRLVAAGDCVRFDMELTHADTGALVSLTWQAENWRDARYKTDWWRPEVMHLAIVLRGIRLAWDSPLPFSPEALLLTSPDWLEPALHNARAVALHLAEHSNPALAGFRKTTFLFPHP